MRVYNGFARCFAAFAQLILFQIAVTSGAENGTELSGNITECLYAPLVENGYIYVEGGNWSIGTIANIACNHGYQPSSLNITCLPSGQWENVTCDITDCGNYAGNLTNGQLIPLDPSNTTFGALVEVLCYPGFSASNFTISCLETGEWENATCEISECVMSPYIENGYIDLYSGIWPIGTITNVTCNLGYTPSSLNITCLPSGQWENVTCDIKECFHFPYVDNGIIYSEGGNWSIGAIANVTCNQGYLPSFSNITCLPSGQWENVSCDIIDCGNYTGNLTNGQLIPLDPSNTTFGALVEVLCYPGFSASNFTIRCLETGEWENATCEISECVMSPYIENGYIDLYSGIWPIGTITNVTCNLGYTPSSFNITCLPSGQWENVTCDIKECFHFPYVDNGIIYSEGGNWSIGAIANVTCNQGYLPSFSNITCLPSGQWENVSCDIIDCGNYTGNLTNGQLIPLDPSNTTFGALVEVLCYPGFSASNFTIRCLETGEWENATCEISECVMSPYIENGYIDLYSGIWPIGTITNVTCNLGYTPSSLNITCLPSGQWENVTCDIKECFHFPYVDNGIIYSEGGNWSIGAIANVTCNQGYLPSFSNITCLPSGQWENVSCDIIDCGNYTGNLTNGQLIPLDPSNTTFGALVEVLCYPGFSASNFTISCLETGEWENATCEISECVMSPYIENGYIDLYSGIWPIGTITNVTCNLGYTPSSFNITCLPSGQWENVTCDIKECFHFPYVDNGIIYSDGGNWSIGAIANVTCNQGYLPSFSNITCLPSGQWENVSCDIIDCGNYTGNLTNGQLIPLDPSNTTFGALVEVLCYPGFSASNFTISCLETGEWENAMCEISECVMSPYIENGYIDLYSGIWPIGTITNVTCNLGYTPSSLNITCLPSGQWENVTCDIKACLTVPLLDNGEISSSEGMNSSIGATANVTCNQGYHSSSTNVTCLSSGQWENATCDVVDCGNYTTYIPNGHIELLDPYNTTYGALVTVRCDYGFEAFPLTLACLETGRWDNATCEPVDCGNVYSIPHGSSMLVDPTNTTFGAIAALSCDDGYESDLTNFQCLEDGQWESVLCNPIDCGAVPFLENGYIVLVDYDNTTLGARADVRCDQGYASDLPQITCLSSGIWDDNVSCIVDGCSDVPLLDDGEIYSSEGRNSSIGSTANVTCNLGYVSNSTYVTCLPSGQWENTTCSIVDCGSYVHDISDGQIEILDPNNTTYGALLTVRCDYGFEAFPLTLRCLETGKWENTTCEPVDCGIMPTVPHGSSMLLDPANTTFGAIATLSCDEGYVTDVSVFQCLEDGQWLNVSCSPVDCGEVPLLGNGKLVQHDADHTSFGARADVLCDLGYTSDISHVVCMSSGLWDDNVTCIVNDCEIDGVPNIENGIVTFNMDGNVTTASVGNVTCNEGFAATSVYIECHGEGMWQSDVFCVNFDLGVVKVEAGQQFINGEQTSFLRCSSSIADGLMYRLIWYMIGMEFFDTGLLDSSETSSFILSDDMIMQNIDAYLHSHMFGAEITCSVAVFDGSGITEHQNRTSATFTPLQVSTGYISMMRGTQETFTVHLNIPFGCSSDSSECFLRFVVYDGDDSYGCYDSTIAIVGSDTCGGKLEGASQTTIGQMTSSSTLTNITITTKNNRWYRLRSFFRLTLKLSAVGNTKTFWNAPSTSVTVYVSENYYSRYRACYSYVDPYMYTFDRRWYSNMLVEEFVMLKHKTLPIEVQTITAYCNHWMTCSCAVTVRAGGDVFTINHCHGHFSGYLSAKDGILRVYKRYATSYVIVLPTGMQVYAYVMPYLYYMMNVYITPSPSEFDQVEGLCGNYNGDYSDDTMLRDTNTLSSVESGNSWWWWWWWWSDYFYPYDFANSWGLQKTGRTDESLLNPDVYQNVERWDNDKKLCVCPYASSSNNFEALCSADEEATCTSPVWRYGSLISATSRDKRSVDNPKSKFDPSQTATEHRIRRMRIKWLNDVYRHDRKKRQANNDTAITYDEAKDICEAKLNSDCGAYTKKENVSEVSNSTDNLDNCARDTMVGNESQWVQSHCDTFTQEVTVELEKDVEFAENNTELAEDIISNSCPGNCSGHGVCVNKTCVCELGFATDLCLLNVTAKPGLEEVGDAGVCDVNTDTCEYITVVGDGFIETASCITHVYEAGMDGSFLFIEEFETNCTYLNFNEVLAPSSTTETSKRRRRREVSDSTNDTTTIATMVGVSVSNDGTHFSTTQYVVILDTTCQQAVTDDNNATFVTLKAGFCFIEGICFTSGSTMNGDSCQQCDTSRELFYWTNGCEGEDDSDTTIIITLSTVGGVVLIVAIIALVVICYYKSTNAERPEQLVIPAQVPSNMKFWYRKPSINFADHPLPEGASGYSKTEEYIPEKNEEVYN